MSNPRNQRVALLLVCAALLGLALYFVLHGVLNADEGFYLAAARLVRDGWRPYRDFGYTQGPAMPYLNVPWLEMFGYSLAGQRYANLAWTSITVATGVIWIARRQTAAEGAMYGLFLLGSPLWLAFAVKGKTYGFAGLAVLLGTIVLFAGWRRWIRWVVFLVAAGLGTSARFPVAGFFLPAGICLLGSTAGWKARVGALTITGLCVAAVMWFATAGNWDNFEFWTVAFHRESSFHIPVWSHFVDCFRFAPVLWVAAATAIWAGLQSVRTRRDQIGVSVPTSVTIGSQSAESSNNQRAQWKVLGSVAIALVLNLSASTTYAEYVLPLFPAVALVAAPFATSVFRRASTAVRAGFVVLTISAGWNYPPEFSPDLLVHAGQAEAYLTAHVPKGAVVVASMPEIPVAAGCSLPRTMSMGMFGITEEVDGATASGRRMLTPDSLVTLLRDPATKAFVGSTAYNWNFFWSLPSYRVLSPAARSLIWQTLREQYDLSYLNNEYAVYLRKL